MPVRQAIGRDNLLRACAQCHPPVDAAAESQRKRDYADNVKELCEIMVDKCVRYKAGSIDDYGLDESLRVFKDAMRDMLLGVKA